MSTIIIDSLTLKAVLDGTEVLEISEGGTGSFKTPVSGFSTIFQLLSLKDAANGYAGLGASSLLNVAQIPTAIPAINIADGTVDNTEFQRLNGITSALEEQGNKGAVSGYAGLDASQELLLANFPSGTGLQVLRRNTGNTALEFATLSDLQGITSINADTTAAQLIVGTTNVITVGTVAGTTTIDIDSAYVGQTSITTLGTITIGVWNGTAITGANINAASTDLTDTAVIARSTDNLSFFSATTSAQLAGVISDETGSGLLVFGTSPTIVTPTIVSFTNATHNHQAAAGGGQLDSTLALSDTANIAYLNTANTWTTGLQNFSAVTLRIPVSATPSVTVDGDIAYDTTVTDFSTGLIRFFGTEEQGIVAMPIAQFTTPSDGFVVSYNATNDEFELTAAGVGDMVLASVQTVTGAKTFGTIGGAVGKFILAGSTSGSTILNAAAIAGTTTVTLQGITGTVALLGDKLDAFAATTSAELASVISDETGSGLLVFGTSPVLITPALGVPSALTLTNATGLPPAGVTGVAAVQTDNLSVFSATTSAQLAGVISDETGSGLLVFATSPTLTTPRFADLGFIADANGNEMLIFDTVASAVNNLQLANAATTNDIIISAVGETNVGININPAGTGLITVDNFVGTGTKRIEREITTTTVALDLTDNDFQTISISANTTFTTSNRSSGRSKTIRILTDGTLRTLTFPAWDFVGTKPADQAASKTGILTLTAFGTADTDIVAAYAVEA